MLQLLKEISLRSVIFEGQSLVPVLLDEYSKSETLLNGAGGRSGNRGLDQGRGRKTRNATEERLD